MIIIEPDVTNEVFFRFLPPIDALNYYVFEFTNTITNQVKIFSADDISNSLCVYHKFEIINNETEDLLNGIVDLSTSGFWTYNVYEMPDASPKSLDIQDALQKVDYGKVLVNQIVTVVPTNVIPKVTIPSNKIN